MSIGYDEIVPGVRQLADTFHLDARVQSSREEFPPARRARCVSNNFICALLRKKSGGTFRRLMFS